MSNAIMTSEDDFIVIDDVNIDDLQRREEIIKHVLDDLLYQTEMNSENLTKRRRIKVSKDFQKLIMCYNNVLFYCSEIVVVDYKHSS